MKVLVLGAGGMAGHVIALRLAELGHDVEGAARRELYFCKNHILDVTDETNLEQILKTEKYDAVVNAAGILPHSIHKNPAKGIWINSYLPHALAKMTADTETKIIHLSTDCVFSGHGTGNYRENDQPDASDLYGRSKSLGELDDNKNLTFRTSIVGPDINNNGKGLFHWFMKQSGQVNGYAGAIWTGISTITLANAVSEALSQNLTGLYQLVNNQTICKYELLGLFNRLRKTPVKIKKNEDIVVNKSLLCNRTDFDFCVPGYEQLTEDIGRWICEHKVYYPCYEQEVKMWTD